MSFLTTLVKNNPLRQQPNTVACGLGWFSIGLGLAELLMPALVERGSGIGRNRPLTRLTGVREIATGVGLLSAADRAPWLNARLAGDVLDIATVLARRRQGSGGSTAMALMALAGVMALDAAAAVAVKNKAQHDDAAAWDYSDRVGIRRQ